MVVGFTSGGGKKDVMKLRKEKKIRMRLKIVEMENKYIK